MPINWDNVEFKDDKRFLSNMYPSPITIDGITYSSSETFYQSMKFTDSSILESIIKSSPIESKKIANSNKKYIREDWHDIKLNVMKFAVLLKFSQNSDLLTKLLDTGDVYLEERNDWNDKFLGYI